MLWTEAEIARDRINSRIATETVLIRAAIIDVVIGGGHFRESLKDLIGE